MIRGKNAAFGLMAMVPLLFAGSVSGAAELTTAPRSKQEFCTRAKQDPRYFQRLLLSPENQLAYTNSGGLGNAGICWWHSRFTRNATYSAIYRPDLPRPTPEQVDQILKTIKGASGVVEIPGYRNLREFSHAHWDKIHGVLEGWQIQHGVFGFGWLFNNIGASDDAKPAHVESAMNSLYNRVKNKGQVVYQNLQMPGVVAHAWLVIDMEKTSNGYRLMVVDSNYSGVAIHLYRRGQTKMPYGDMYPFTPWVGHTGELDNLVSNVESHCEIPLSASREEALTIESMN